MKQSKHQKRVELVLQRLINLSNSDREWCDEIALILDEALDAHAENDGFGTERQMDPRGDGRTGKWHMCKVEGVD